MKDGEEKGSGKPDHVMVDVEMGTPGTSQPTKVSTSGKTTSGRVVVDLGKRVFSTYDLARYYNTATKTLDLSHQQMGDEGLAAIFDPIRHFISENDTEILLLEDMNLTKVPYYLVTYALVDKHLQVVSFQNNHFKIPGLPVMDESAAPSATGSGRNSVNLSAKRDSKRASMPIAQMFQASQGAASSKGGGTASAVAQMVTTLWESFSPEIARELEEQQLGENIVPLFKKIIFIDKRIPPITVFDQTQTVVSQAAPAKWQRFKYIVERALYTVAGIAVSFLPQIIILFTNKSGTVECSDASAQTIIQACCNASETRGIIIDGISDKNISEKVESSKSDAS